MTNLREEIVCKIIFLQDKRLSVRERGKGKEGKEGRKRKNERKPKKLYPQL